MIGVLFFIFVIFDILTC